MKIITFIDSIGRTIIADEINTENQILSVRNPAMINVVQSQNGQLQVQLIPLFFTEFIEPSTRGDGTTWEYNTQNITRGSVTFDQKLIEQYTRVFNAAAAAPPQEAPVIKLFED
jgi:hypothetical protein